MYCDRCGHPVSDSAQFCSACGKPLAPPPVQVVPARVVTPYDGRVGRHIKVLASLWLIYAVWRFMGMAWVFLIGRTFVPAAVQEIIANAEVPFRFPLAHLISGGLMFAAFWAGAFAILELIAAWGLFERRPWARILTLILGFIALIRFPFGTALGIYTLWVLLPGPAAQEYERLTASRI